MTTFLRRSVAPLCLLVATVATGCTNDDVFAGPAGGGASTSSCATPKTQLLATAPDGLPRIAIDDAFVYYTSKSGVFRVAKTGGAPLQLARTANDFSVLAVVRVDSKSVYYFDKDTNDSSKLAVYRTPKDGSGALAGAGAATRLVTVADAGGLEVSRNVLYVSEQIPGTTRVESAPRGRMLGVDLTTLAVVELATGLRAPREPTVDDDYVYWFDGESDASPPIYDGRLMRVKKTGGTPEILLKDDKQKDGYRNLTGTLVDDSFVYYTSIFFPAAANDPPLDASFYRIPKDGSGAPTRVSKVGPLWSAGAAFEADHFYVAEGNFVADVSTATGDYKELICTTAAESLAADATTIFFTDGTKILSMPR